MSAPPANLPAFSTTKCPVPFVPQIPWDVIVQNCQIPGAPTPIPDCADTSLPIAPMDVVAVAAAVAAATQGPAGPPCPYCEKLTVPALSTGATTVNLTESLSVKLVGGGDCWTLSEEVCVTLPDGKAYPGTLTALNNTGGFWLLGVTFTTAYSGSGTVAGIANICHGVCAVSCPPCETLAMNSSGPTTTFSLTENATYSLTGSGSCWTPGEPVCVTLNDDSTHSGTISTISQGVGTGYWTFSLACPNDPYIGTGLTAGQATLCHGVCAPVMSWKPFVGKVTSTGATMHFTAQVLDATGALIAGIPAATVFTDLNQVTNLPVGLLFSGLAAFYTDSSNVPHAKYFSAIPVGFCFAVAVSAPTGTMGTFNTTCAATYTVNWLGATFSSSISVVMQRPPGTTTPGQIGIAHFPLAGGDVVLDWVDEIPATQLRTVVTGGSWDSVAGAITLTTEQELVLDYNPTPGTPITIGASDCTPSS